MHGGSDSRGVEAVMAVVPSEKLAVHFHVPRDNASPLFWSLSRCVYALLNF